MTEFAVSWHTKPYKGKHPVMGSFVPDCGVNGKLRPLLNAPVESTVVAHLHSKFSVFSGSPALTSRVDCFQSSLTENPPVVLSVHTLDATSLPMAYQADLEEDIAVAPGTML